MRVLTLTAAPGATRQLPQWLTKNYVLALQETAKAMQTFERLQHATSQKRVCGGCV